MPACSWANPARRSALAALNWIVESWRSVRRSASSRLTPSAPKVMTGAASTGVASVTGRRRAAPVGAGCPAGVVTGADVVPGAGGWLVGAGELGGGGCRGTAWPCAVVAIPARMSADTGPMTRTMRRGRRATLLLITRLLTCDPTGTSPKGCEPSGPRTGGVGSSQHSTPKPRDPNAAVMDARDAHRRRARGDTRRSRPLGGGILPELPRVIGSCSDGGRGPLVLGVGGRRAVPSRRRRPVRAIAGGTPLC